MLRSLLLCRVDGIVHTCDEGGAPSAWSIHSVVATSQQQNHRCQSSLALHPSLLDTTCPFRKKPTSLNVLFAHVVLHQSAAQFLRALVQELTSRQQMLFLLALLLFRKIFH